MGPFPKKHMLGLKPLAGADEGAARAVWRFLSAQVDLKSSAVG